MYICVCKGINEKTLQEGIKNSKSFGEVCKKLGIGTDCGLCLLQNDKIKSLVNNQSQDATKK